MRKFIIPLMLIAFLVAFYEQSKSDSNVYLMVGAVVVFMYCMMQLSAKTPSKNPHDNEADI